MMINLASSIAIVTGASRGLGRAICELLVKQGVRVYGVARDENRLKELRSELGDNFRPVPLDLTHREEVNAWLESEFRDEFPNILINNAGVGFFEKIDELPEARWDAMLSVNLHGLYNITAPVVALMKKGDRGGYIINIGSILGITTRSEGAAYSATKFAIRGFSESLMKELRGFNIKVTCLNPGSIDTHFFESSGIKPHHNMLQPRELAETVLFLLQTPPNLLIDELTVRPLDARKPEK